jgi:hypothetical protein
MIGPSGTSRMRLTAWDVGWPITSLIRISAAAIALTVVCLALRLKIIYYDIGVLASALNSLSDVWHVLIGAITISYADKVLIRGFDVC